MKRLFPIMLTVLLLCGCVREPGGTLTTVPTQANIEDSLWEMCAEGLDSYSLGDSFYSDVCFMGDELLLFCNEDRTHLLKLSRDLTETASVQLDTSISASDASVRVSDKGVTYYDGTELVFLDTSLKEVSRVSLPEDILGTPVLSADRRSIYYCVSDALRVLDLETGLDKLLKEMFFGYQSPVELHCGDSIVECVVEDSQGNWSRLFIYTKNGETARETSYKLELTTDRENYFAVNYDGAYRELLYGVIGELPQALRYEGISADATPLLDSGCVILTDRDETEQRTSLEYYDLTGGKRTASLELSGECQPFSICAEPDGGCLFFLTLDSAGVSNVLYRWTPEKTPTDDETSCFGTRYNDREPDVEGLARCRERADEIAQCYDVEIRLWQDAVSVEPSEHTLEAEYQVPLIMDCLEQLDEALACYPTGFLKKAALGTTSGTLRICLVRGIYGSGDAGSLDVSSGLQFWDAQEDAYICLQADETLEQNFHHELFHVIDSRVLSTCSAYDSWNTLNPEGFSYDYDYRHDQSGTDRRWLDGDQRAFVDTYSMSFPKEDRARIMEYAMMDGNGELFKAPALQAKLRQLCLGIRQTFELEASAQTYPWEQYLTE